MPRQSPFVATALLCALLVSVLPAQAGRQIVDLHKLDAYFALFARDSNVPWKATTVRLDTYSSAPVQFSAYEVDPADVIIAGSNVRPRAIDVGRYKPVVHWTFTPPGGYRFQSSEVPVPLGTREGFFVVEARRGSIGEQVWINRTRVGLLTKESPGGMLVYGVDLGTGRALDRLRVSFVEGNRFVDRYSDAHGIVRWHGKPRPIFALATWGQSSAFVSFLPEAPLPATIVGVKVDSAVVHGGDDVRVVGFARSRSGSRLKVTSGTAELTLRLRGAVVAASNVRLDPAGAFTATMHLPQNSPSGDYAVLAVVNGATAGTSLHVDANADGLALEILPPCEGLCSAQSDVPIVLKASRAGIPVPNVHVHVNVIRSPHIYLTYTPTQTPWGTTSWLDTAVLTDSKGEARVRIARPTDGLASTYGIRADAGGATAATRIIVPTSSIALRLHVDDAQQSLGSALGFDLYAVEVATARPLAKVTARVRLVHGNSAQEQVLNLDADGHARGSFSSPEIGDNLIIASAVAGGDDVLDAQEVQVVPQALLENAGGTSSDVTIDLNKPIYSAGERVDASASVGGSSGDALFTLESAQDALPVLAADNSGRAVASFKAGDASGELAIGAAFVSDGSLRWSTSPLVLSAPGRPVPAPLKLERQNFSPNENATIRIDEERPTSGTLVLRMTQGTPSGSALFDTAPDLLDIGTTTTQDSAPSLPSWHPWVDSTGTRAPVIAFERRAGKAPQDFSLADADTKDLYWKIDRNAGETVQVPVPGKPGRYVLSMLKIDDDGRVSASSSDIVVR
ncbi:MAG: hypothetical protein ABI182_07125 [Candidatus Baltobacteraceae bacterium]